MTGFVPEERTGQGSLADLLANSISVPEASEISGFTPGWIRQLLIRGEFDGFKIGRDWRLTREALQQYLDKERRPGPAWPRRSRTELNRNWRRVHLSSNCVHLNTI